MVWSKASVHKAWETIGEILEQLLDNLLARVHVMRVAERREPGWRCCHHHQKKAQQ
jgi:hypothetical protein